MNKLKSSFSAIDSSTLILSPGAQKVLLCQLHELINPVLLPPTPTSLIEEELDISTLLKHPQFQDWRQAFFIQTKFTFSFDNLSPFFSVFSLILEPVHIELWDLPWNKAFKDIFKAFPANYQKGKFFLLETEQSGKKQAASYISQKFAQMYTLLLALGATPSPRSIGYRQWTESLPQSFFSNNFGEGAYGGRVELDFVLNEDKQRQEYQQFLNNTDILAKEAELEDMLPGFEEQLSKIAQSHQVLNLGNPQVLDLFKSNATFQKNLFLFLEKSQLEASIVPKYSAEPYSSLTKSVYKI